MTNYELIVGQFTTGGVDHRRAAGSNKPVHVSTFWHDRLQSITNGPVGYCSLFTVSSGTPLFIVIINCLLDFVGGGQYNPGCKSKTGI